VDNTDEEEYDDAEYADNNNMFQDDGHGDPNPSVTPKTNKGRRRGTRRDTQETRPLILKAIESELRKGSLKP